MDSKTPGNGTTKKELTEDLIVEILVRLPVKTLLRFKCVSKFWYSLILSPRFIAIHYTHSHSKNKVSLLCLSCRSNRSNGTTVSFRFGDVPKFLTFPAHTDNVKISGCFKGVVCLSISSTRSLNDKYALWNPATTQLRQIGSSTMDGRYSTLDGWYGSGFCFDPVTNAFKIAQIKLAGKGGGTRVQFNMFSTGSNSWTEKNIDIPYRIRGSGINTICGATCVNGYIHWHITILDRDGKLDDMYILSYDMIDEAFERIEMPFQPVDCYVRLASYKGSLSMFVHRWTPNGGNISYAEVDVWVMNECGGANQSWCKLWTCRPSIKVMYAVGFFSKDDNDDLLLLSEYPRGFLFLYDPQRMETKRMDIKKSWEAESALRTFPYSESLLSLN